MKALLAALLFAIAGSALAAEPAEKPSQQNRMKQCNQDAVGKKGDERKQFMSACLKGEAAPTGAAPAPAADPAASACASQAAEKKLAGAAKASFVKKCMADGGAAAPASGATDACAKQATEKKLAGAAKNSFMKKCEADAK